MRKQKQRGRALVLLLHPIVGCLEEESRLYALVKDIPLACVCVEKTPFWGGSDKSPDFCGERCREIGRHIAAGRRVPLVSLPAYGVVRLLRDPLRGEKMLKELCPQAIQTPMVCFPVGVPPEELRPLDGKAGKPLRGIAVDWLAAPQRIFPAEWDELIAPLCGVQPAELNCTVFPDRPKENWSGCLYLKEGLRKRQLVWDNREKNERTSSSLLYYTDTACKLVFKSARAVLADGVDRRGPEYGEKLFRLNLLESVLTWQGVENALPIRLLKKEGGLAGFVMYDVSELGKDMTFLVLSEDEGGYNALDMAAALENLCVCTAFYNRLGVFFSDIKIDNFFLGKDWVIPIDTDGFSLMGSAASMCRENFRRPGGNYKQVPYYHSAENEAYALAKLLFYILRGSYILPNQVNEERDLPEFLQKAFVQSCTETPTDVFQWAELMHRYRLELEQQWAPGRTDHAVSERTGLWQSFCPVEAEPPVMRLSRPVEICFDHR